MRATSCPHSPPLPPLVDTSAAWSRIAPANRLTVVYASRVSVRSVYYWCLTVMPEIFMMKTAMWCMGWGCCTWIFVLGLLETPPVYSM